MTGCWLSDFTVMVSLKDLLSQESKENLLQSIGKGDIIRMKLTTAEGITPKNPGDTDRNKYFVVLGKTPDGGLIGFVIINTRINEKLSPKLKALHYPISSSKYPFLEINRFVFCGDLKEISSDVFAHRYKCESFGKIADDDMELIIATVIQSGNVSPKRLKKFGLLK